MGGGGSKKPNATPAGSFSWQGGGGGGNFSPEDFNKTMGSDILAAYKQGPADVYGKSLYTGLSGTTQQGLQGLLNTANQNAGMFDAGIDYTQGLLSGGGFAGGQQGNVNTINQVAGQYGGIAGDLSNPSAAETGLMGLADQFSGPSAAQTGFMSMYENAGAPSLTEETLLARARGDEIANNPFLDDIIAQTSDNTFADVMASLGGSGRTGSSLHVETLSDALSDAENRLRYADYNNALDRQAQALSAIEGMRQQGFSNQFNALGASDSARFNQANARAGMLTGADAARLNQLNARMGALGAQAGAAGNAFNMEQQGVANAMGATAALPGLFDASLLPSQTILGVGQARDADAQAKRLAEFEQFQRTNDPTFNHIAKYQGLLSSQAGNPQPEKQPGLFDWLGLGIAGAGVLL